MNDVVTAWTPLIVALIASATTLAGGIGPTVRYARLEKLLIARPEGDALPKVDLLIDVLAAGLIVEENSIQQRTRIWWAVWTGVLFVASLIALATGWGLWFPAPADAEVANSANADAESPNQTLQLIGLASSLIMLPLFVRSLWALFRPRTQSILVPPKGTFDRSQAAERLSASPSSTPTTRPTEPRSGTGPTSSSAQTTPTPVIEGSEPE